MVISTHLQDNGHIYRMWGHYIRGPSIVSLYLSASEAIKGCLYHGDSFSQRHLRVGNANEWFSGLTLLEASAVTASAGCSTQEFLLLLYFSDGFPWCSWRTALPLKYWCFPELCPLSLLPFIINRLLFNVIHPHRLTATCLPKLSLLSCLSPLCLSGTSYYWAISQTALVSWCIKHPSFSFYFILLSQYFPTAVSPLSTPPSPPFLVSTPLLLFRQQQASQEYQPDMA